MELEGYNGRWIEHWAPFRRLCTLIFNANAAKGQHIQEYQYMALYPKDFEQLAMDAYVDEVRFGMEMKLD